MIEELKLAYWRWKAKRELRKAAPMLEKLANTLPSYALNGLFYQDGKPLNAIEARNMLLRVSSKIAKA
jgi:hypothetical protein